MALYPGAAVRLVPEWESEPAMTATQLIYHSAVGHGSLAGYFARRDIDLESHFWVSKTGQVEQYQDTARQADANYKANARAISVETEDDGDPDTQPWTDAQIAAMAKLGAWCVQRHPIDVRLCPAWDASGVGYHTLFGAPSPWTPVRKTCPGRARIAQFHTLLLPAIVLAVGYAAPTPTLEDDVAVRPIICDDGDPAQYAIIGGRRKKFGSLDEMRRHVQAGLIAPNPAKPADPAAPVKWSRAELNAYPELRP